MNDQHKILMQVLRDNGCQVLTNWQSEWTDGTINHYTVKLPGKGLRMLIVQEYGDNGIDTYINDEGIRYSDTLQALGLPPVMGEFDING